MQTPDQRNNRSKPRDWKVAAVVAAASTVGLSGIALAGSDTPPVPEPIELSDAVSIEAVNSTTTTIRPSRLAPAADTKAKKPTTTKAKKPTTTTTTQPQDAQRSLSSPFDDAPDDVLRPLPIDGDDSPGTQDSPQDPSPDSPATPDNPSPDSPATPDNPSPDSPATPDEPSPDSPATPDEPSPDSPASAQSPQSAQSTDSPDD